MNIKKNVDENKRKIEELKAKHQINREIIVCAATKYVGPEEMKELVQNGVYHMGENRVESFLEKYQQLKNEPITWHFIGTLQSRKVKDMINQIDYLHSLDRMSLVKAIEKHRDQVLNCFVQVNCSHESSKHGLNESETIDFIKTLEPYSKIKVVGLMTMAENTHDRDVISMTFRSLKMLQERIIQLNLHHAPCTELSMGMSSDYDLAIPEGASVIRIGSSLFK